MRQLGQKNGSLYAVQSAVDAFHHVFAFTTMSREGSHPVGEFRLVIGDDATGISIRAEVLARIERECRRISKCAYWLTLIAGEMRLGAVFDYPKSMLARDRA